jgi:hypothetical protein
VIKIPPKAAVEQMPISLEKPVEWGMDLAHASKSPRAALASF